MYLLKWYAWLCANPDEFDRLLHSSMYQLSTFLDFFRDKAVSLVHVDPDTDCIDMLVWFEPVMSGAWIGIWIDPKHRDSKVALELAGPAYKWGVEHFKVVVGACKQEYLRVHHARLGYVYMGQVPALWEGDPVDVYYMTKDTFKDPRTNPEWGRG